MESQRFRPVSIIIRVTPESTMPEMYQSNFRQDNGRSAQYETRSSTARFNQIHTDKAPPLLCSSAAKMLGARPEPNKTRRYLSEHGKPFQQLHHKRERVLAIGGPASHNPVMN